MSLDPVIGTTFSDTRGMPVILVDWQRLLLPVAVPTPTTLCTPFDPLPVLVVDSAHWCRHTTGVVALCLLPG
jgi:hypothetical protein